MLTEAKPSGPQLIWDADTAFEANLLALYKHALDGGHGFAFGSMELPPEVHQQIDVVSELLEEGRPS